MTDYKKRLILSVAVFAYLLAFFVNSVPAFASSQEQVLYSFCIANDCAPYGYSVDGDWPWAALAFDALGNLYGTTQTGGNLTNCKGHGCGTIFELAPSGTGTWLETVLYNFCPTAGCKDGSAPLAALTPDPKGNFYGTTSSGGDYGMGAVFKLSPSAEGTWTYSVLHSFDGDDGSGPLAGVTVAANGKLYGTTDAGGTFGDGAVFELTPTKTGTWNETVIYNFEGRGTGNGKDGIQPYGGLVLDHTGNLYGTTDWGGNQGGCRNRGCGTVFKLTHGGKGQWQRTILHRFRFHEGAYPWAGLIFDKAGNLYGTTSGGGTKGCSGRLGCGTVFELSPTAHGRWKLSVLYKFLGYSDGGVPYGEVSLDAAGRLYGATYFGGRDNKGVVFQLAPAGEGWTETVLYTFCSVFGCADGTGPTSGVTLDSVGNIFGTTLLGGNAGCNGVGCGLIFEITH